MSNDDSKSLPSELRANAWCGEEARGPVDAASIAWGSRRDLPLPSQPLAPKPLDLANWEDPRVGWGVVLPDRDDVPASDKAVGADAPEPIRELIKCRGNVPVFRYRPDLKEGQLRRYAADGSASDPAFKGPRGAEGNAIPYYLLIVGSPVEIPWRAQYRMQPDAFVGRLDLDAAGLERYVEALIGNWGGDPHDTAKPVIWAVDHGHPDITRLMRKTIAERLNKAFTEDPDAEFDMTDGFRSDAKATHSELNSALAKRNPAFVMSSSHGATYPLNDAVIMRTQLGLPVDDVHTTLNVAALTGAWNPYGAIWYAHACCSAGADATSKFAGLVTKDSTLGETLSAIAKVGACSAPLPRALLGGANPARAFLGHVEPTFDWTLRDPVTGQVTTQHIIDALYSQLHLASRPPIGLAMSVYFEAVGGLLQDYDAAIEDVDAHMTGAVERARRAKLVALDRLALVLLGDPTVRLSRPA